MFSLVDFDYVELMDEKEAAKKTAFGPTPTKVVREWYETKWRTEPVLHEKVASAAKVEEFEAELRSGAKGKISVNAQVNFALEAFIKTYEAQFGTLPPKSATAALKRYAKHKLESEPTNCPHCGQKMPKK